jgi:DnaJ-class molecular chaperone
VSPDADQEALKKAYRLLAVRWHPDRNPGSRVAEERFKAMAEAYAVLSDPKKRRRYDELGHDGFGGEFDPEEIFEGFDPSYLFKEFGIPDDRETLARLLDLDGGETPDPARITGFFGDFGLKQGPRARPAVGGRDLAVPLSASLKEAVFGAMKPAAFNSSKGVVKVMVRLPPGTKNGDVITVPGKVPPPGKGLPGDLKVTVSVVPDPGFKVVGRDIVTSLKLKRSELASGCRPSVATLDGKTLRLAVPPGTAQGARLKAAGHGVPSRTGRGALIVTIETSG